MSPTPSHVLVTGGAGFIGSHLVDTLLAAGAHVTVLDDLSTGRREHLPPHERLRLVVGDVADERALADAVTGCTTVAHLAAIASVQRSVEDPVGTHRTNYVATQRLALAAAAAGVQRLVYASSAAVYGDVQSPPVREDGGTDPQTPYAIDKLMGEAFLAFCRRIHGLEAVSLRFFNVYGPRQDPSSPYSGVISRFADRARAGAPVTIFGDGLQTRDFVFVGDVVRAIVTCLDPARAAPAGPCNVGTGGGTTVLELVAAVERAAGRPLERRFEESRRGEVRHSVADASALRSLGWTATTGLDDGLARTV